MQPNRSVTPAPLPSGTTATPFTQLAHNPRGQLTETIDPEGRVTRHTYDPASGDLPSTSIDPAGLAITTTRSYTRRTWVFRKSRCAHRAPDQSHQQGTPTSRSGYYGEEA